MSWYQKLNAIADIPDYEYTGYSWISNNKEPQFILNKSDLLPYQNKEKPSVPFILEAYLYCKNEDISISVRHVSGCYLIYQFMLKKLGENKDNVVEKNYIAHKNLGEMLCFKEIWLPEEDKFCEGMEILKKQIVVFTGFAKAC